MGRGVVYKVIIAVNPTMIKKAKKLGLDQFKTIYFDDTMLNITDNNRKAPGNFVDNKFKQGKYIIMYYPNTNNDYQIYEGEVTESEQLQLK